MAPKTKTDSSSGEDEPPALSGAKRDRESWVASANTAVFIQKTYDMITRCDPSVACWSEAGDVFIVKEASKLASIFIPRYFDHNNFSSFARQLNFYGFRKINSLHEANGLNSSHVKFYHEFFQKNHPELLCKIKRSTLNNGSSKVVNKEIETLKKTVSTLEERISKMSSDFESQMGRMFELVEKALKQSECKCKEAEPHLKRRKMDNGFPPLRPDVKADGLSFDAFKDHPNFSRQQSVQSVASDFLGILINDPTLQTAADAQDFSQFHNLETDHIFTMPERPTSGNVALPAALKQIPKPEMGIIRFLSDLSTGRGFPATDKEKKIEINESKV